MIGPWYNSLRVQILLLMTVALLPLGAIAIYQTNSVAKEADRNAELALLALTERAAKEEELIIERAVGTARFFALIANSFLENPERCTAGLGEFVSGEDNYSHIGILPSSGVMDCSSSGQTYDLSSLPGLQKNMATREASISLVHNGPISGTSVFIVLEPYKVAGKFAGFVTLSILHNSLPDTSNELIDLGLQDLITYNTNGEILTARSNLEDAKGELPSNRSLKALTSTDSLAFEDRNRNGVQRTYTVVPIQGSPAAVIAVWRRDNGVESRVSNYVGPSLFPILMWIASMVVAMLAIHSLVLRHITRLRLDMDSFATNRAIAEKGKTSRMPNEFRYLNENFAQMTDDLMQDEAKLEDILREKNVLIKEVHHRVKNNLQLISSIMSMKIRTAEHEETKSVLLRLQDRVLSLAIIHRDLYQSDNAGMVDVGKLVSEIVQNTFEVAIASNIAADLDTEIEAVLLYPDQAVPLSLLCAEAMTNAMKYLGAPASHKPQLSVCLKQEAGLCTLTLENTVGDEGDAESTGLGKKLINAFAIQLGARVEVEESEARYKITVHFTAEEFEPDTPDF